MQGVCVRMSESTSHSYIDATLIGLSGPSKSIIPSKKVLLLWEEKETNLYTGTFPQNRTHLTPRSKFGEPCYKVIWAGRIKMKSLHMGSNNLTCNSRVMSSLILRTSPMCNSHWIPVCSNPSSLQLVIHLWHLQFLVGTLSLWNI